MVFELMCSIMGYCGQGMPLEKFREGFARTRSRGPDDSGLSTRGRGCWHFTGWPLWAPSRKGCSPLGRDGDFLVCNGEIYGFRPMKKELEEKGYTFQSGSDCEILLPLYREYGFDMFAKLDAEFAMVLYDGGPASSSPPGTPSASGPCSTGKMTEGDALCQRGQEPGGPVPEGRPLPAGALLRRGEVRLLPGRDPGEKGVLRQPGTPSAGTSGKSSLPALPSGWIPTCPWGSSSAAAWIPPWCAPWRPSS